jgi:PAS domain-containing protein
MLTSGIKRGKPMHNKGTELVIFRNGFLESAFFDFVFLPIPSPDGRFIGVLNDFIETTTAVLQEDRQRVCKKLIVGVTGAIEVRNVWQTLINVLKDCKDVSFAIVYAHDSTSAPDSDTSSMRAQFSFGIDTHGSVISSSISEIVGQSVNKVHVLDRPKGTLPLELEVNVPKLGVVHTSYVLPIDGLYGQRVSAVVVIGSNPVRAVDPGSIQYFESLRDLLFKSIALLSLPAEQRRANELSTALSYQLAVATSKAEQSEKNFTEMVHHAPIGMCMDRGDGHPVYVNDVYLDLIGTDRTSFFDAAKAGFAWRSADFQPNADAIEETWRTAVKSGKTANFEISVGCDTAPRWLEMFVQQRYDENGVLVFIFSWLTDISARKAVESVVEERLAEAIENRRASENFIDMVRMILVNVWKSRGLTFPRYRTRCATLCLASYNWPTAYR